MIECYLLTETDKARLLHIRSTAAQLWIPKSVTPYVKTMEIPEGMEDKMPGKPTLVEIAPWFIRKNRDIAEKLGV
jgi:hypothetical protein